MSSDPEKIEKENHCCGWSRKCLFIPFIILAVVLIKSALVMVLWNWLVPELFHGPVLRFCQAIGVVILAKLLVGFGWGCRPGHGRFGPPWRRWEGLTPEEKAKLREEIRTRCE